MHVSTTSPAPRSHIHALHDPNWKHAMLDEYNDLITNGTWVLVPRPQNVNVIRSMWLLKHKFNANGSLSRYKARLVANGRSQQQGIDCDETFSPVVKPANIRTVLSLAVSRAWPIHQIDVKNAFLHGHLSETVYMHQPPGFVDPTHPNHVCLLQKSLYGLKQAPVHGFRDLRVMLLGLVFNTAGKIISSLYGEFSMIELGPLNYFLGISAYRTSSGLFLSLTKYATEVLKRAHMLNYNPCKTPVDTDTKHGTHGLPVEDPSFYHRAGCPTTWRSTSDYCVFLGGNLLTWSSKRQHVTSRSSAEAEYRGVANVVAETAWVRNLLRELHSPLCTATLVYCDNISAVYLSYNPVQHQRIKHIEIDLHFVRDFVATGHVRVLPVPTKYPYADIFTKGLPSPLFTEFRSSLSVRPSPPSTAGAY
nr:ribonuclease H-like domain-containing protein [Tanacetum cinerariifolium]